MVIKTAPYGIFRTALFLSRYLLDIYSLHFALMNSRFRRAMLLNEMFFGHSAAHAPVLVQLPNPSSSIFLTIARARRRRSTWPWGRSANWLTLALTNSIAEPFLQAATQAPQPIHVAESIASSATSYEMFVE